MTAPTPPSSTTARRRDGEPGLAATLARYTVARVAVVAVIAGLLTLAGVPFLLSLLVALIVALPLSMVLFRGLRARLDRAIAARRAERDVLRAQLRGDAPAPGAPADGTSAAPEEAGSDRPGEGEPEGRRG